MATRTKKVLLGQTTGGFGGCLIKVIEMVSAVHTIETKVTNAGPEMAVNEAIMESDPNIAVEQANPRLSRHGHGKLKTPRLSWEEIK